MYIKKYECLIRILCQVHFFLNSTDFFITYCRELFEYSLLLFLNDGVIYIEQQQNIYIYILTNELYTLNVYTYIYNITLWYHPFIVYFVFVWLNYYLLLFHQLETLDLNSLTSCNPSFNSINISSCFFVQTGNFFDCH